jgi:hypothetical protein
VTLLLGVTLQIEVLNNMVHIGLHINAAQAEPDVRMRMIPKKWAGKR